MATRSDILINANRSFKSNYFHIRILLPLSGNGAVSTMQVAVSIADAADRN